MAFWIFQTNERKSFWLTDALAVIGQHANKMTADVRQHVHEVHPGDTVYMWTTGPTGGIVAVAKVLTEPSAVEEEQWEFAFHVSPNPPNRVYPHVRLEVVTIFPRPIARKVVKATPDLKSMHILRFARQTNYRLTADEVRAIKGLIEAKAWELAPSSPPDRPFRASSARIDGSPI